GWAERRASRRSAAGTVHRARARGPNTRPARRSDRGARAGLQHGLQARRLAGYRRVQSDVPSSGRRRRYLLAATGAGLEDRVFFLGTGVAPPSIDSEGLLAPTGRLRRG